jgi:hypothetical protein
MLTEATRQAVRNLDNLVLIKPEQSPEIARLRWELDLFLPKNHARVAAEARSASCQAKESSRRHRIELTKMKKVAHEAAEKVVECEKRYCHSESQAA